MPTQRQFHAAVQEIRGERVMTVPGAAQEMVPLMRPDEADRGRRVIVEEIERRRQHGRGRRGADNVLNAEAQLWWLDEWARPDGLYGVRDLNTQEIERYETLMDCVPPEGFTGTTDRESLRGLPDAQIVCETLAIDGMLLLTYDPNTIRPKKLEPWTRALARAGWISHGKVIEEADDANERWIVETPEDMLLGTIVAAWPQETNAGPKQVRERIDELIKRLAGAGLEKTGEGLKELVGRANNLPELIERTNTALPVQMRNAERRSPYTSWSGTEEQPRGSLFTMTWTGAAMALRHRSLSGNVHQWGGWGKTQLAEMERFLSERNINVEGLPAPRSDGGSGFVGAMGEAIETIEASQGANAEERQEQRELANSPGAEKAVRDGIDALSPADTAIREALEHESDGYVPLHKREGGTRTTVDSGEKPRTETARGAGPKTGQGDAKLRPPDDSGTLGY